MACERKLALVAAVALLAGCAGHATTVGTASTPTPAAGDGGSGDPGDGSAGTTGTGDGGGSVDGGVATPCSKSPAPFATGALIAASDAAYVYAFSGQRLVRIALGGAAPELVVDGIDTTIDFDASVDDRFVYWRLHGSDGQVPALVRVPKAGGATSVLGTGGGDAARAPYVIANPIYFMHDGFYDTMAPDGSGQAEALSDDHILTANAHNVFYLDTSDGLRIHTLPTTAAPTAHSTSYVEADDRFVYLLWSNELRRYTIANSTYVVIARFDGTISDTPSALRLAGARVYIMVGFATDPHHIEAVGTDGSNHVTVASDVSEWWTVAGDSVYFDRAGDIYRVCR